MKANSGVSFVLTKLIDVNNQRVLLYKSLVDRSRDMELKILFMQYAIQAQSFMATLNKWGLTYGADIHPKRHFFDNVQKMLKGLFSSGGRNMHLNQCESMEKKALKLYKTVVAMSFLPHATIAEVNRQADELEKASRSLKSVITGEAASWQVAFS
ncbi:MAG TPA: hypothetical protein VG737_00440 [Cyclobacteriaceae bacterium]|nr:hypothetical protein [Cyclobacteriaceae bacterium]